MPRLYAESFDAATVTADPAGDRVGTGASYWTGSGVDASLETGNPASGTAAARLTDLALDAALFSSSVPCSPGDDLTVTLYVRRATATNRAAKLYLRWDALTSTSSAATATSLTVNGVWQQVSHTVRVPSDATGCSITLDVPTHTLADTFLLDAVTLDASTPGVIESPPSGERSYARELAERFDKPDGVGLGPDLPWLQTRGGANGNVHTKGGRASSDPSATSPFRTRARVEVDLSHPDHWAQSVVPTDGDGTARVAAVCVRFDGENGCYVARLNCASARQPTLALQRMSPSSSATTLVEATRPPSTVLAPYTFRLEVEGSSPVRLVGRVNEVVVFDVADTSPDAHTTARRTGVDMQDMADVLFLDTFTAGVFGQSALVLGGTVAMAGTARRAPRLAARGGSLRPAAAVVTTRAVTRALGGALAATGTTRALGRLRRQLGGALAPQGSQQGVRTALHTVAGALRPAGQPVRRAARLVGGAVTPAAVRRLAAARRLGGALAVAGASLPLSLGRVFGRSGIVALAVRAAGEVRLRVRRPT